MKKYFITALAAVCIIGGFAYPKPVEANPQARACIQLRSYFVATTFASSIMSGANGTGAFIVAAQPNTHVFPLAETNGHGWRRIRFIMGGTTHVGYIRANHLSFTAVYAC